MKIIVVIVVAVCLFFVCAVAWAQRSGQAGTYNIERVRTPESTKVFFGDVVGFSCIHQNKEDNKEGDGDYCYVLTKR